MKSLNSTVAFFLGTLIEAGIALSNRLPDQYRINLVMFFFKL